MPFGAKVDLNPGHIVLDRDQAAPTKGAQQPPRVFLAHVYCGHGRPSQLLLSFIMELLAVSEISTQIETHFVLCMCRECNGDED